MMKFNQVLFRISLLAGLIFASLFFITPPDPVEAAPVIYVRTDGDDALCNGTADAPASAAPNCAVASVLQAVALVDPGGTIYIGAGTFTGSAQIQINQNVTIIGSGEGVTTLLPGFNTGSSGAARGWFYISPGNNLNIQDLTMDAAANQVFQGFRFDNASGNIERLTIQNIRYGTYLGGGIAAMNGVVNVRESTFNNIERRGIIYFDVGASGSIFEDNTYLGKGDGDFLDYGVEISAGADVIVRNNTIQDNRGVAASDGSVSAGILITNFFNQSVASNVLIERNNLLDNSNGVYMGYCFALDDPIGSCDAGDTSTATLVANRIVGNTNAGVVAVGDTAVTALNNWWGCNAGPGGVGCDTVSASNNATISTDPYLLLTVTTGTPTCIDSTATGTLTASLRENSSGVVFGPPYVPDDIQVDFTVSAGSIISPAFTVDGLATTTFSGAPSSTVLNFTITVDNQTINTSLTTPDCEPPVITPTPLPTTPPSDGGQPGITVFDPGISKLGVLTRGQAGVAGEQVEWIVTVSNTSGSTGYNVVVSDTLNDGLRLVAVDAPGAAVTTDGQRVTVTIPQLNPGSSYTFSIITQFISGIQIENTACVSGGNISREVCTTASQVAGSLPATGEAPIWRVPLIALLFSLLLVSLGGGVLFLRRRTA